MGKLKFHAEVHRASSDPLRASSYLLELERLNELQPILAEDN
jgi:hypothetical protein